MLMLCNSIKRLLTISCVGMLFFAAPVSWAQNGENGEAQQKESETAEQQAENKQTEDDQAKDSEQEKNETGREPAPNTSGVFVPSEEISQDIPVSFPVDI